MHFGSKLKVLGSILASRWGSWGAFWEVLRLYVGGILKMDPPRSRKVISGPPLASLLGAKLEAKIDQNRSQEGSKTLLRTVTSFCLNFSSIFIDFGRQNPSKMESKSSNFSVRFLYQIFHRFCINFASIFESQNQQKNNRRFSQTAIELRTSE